MISRNNKLIELSLLREDDEKQKTGRDRNESSSCLQGTGDGPVFYSRPGDCGKGGNRLSLKFKASPTRYFWL